MNRRPGIMNTISAKIIAPAIILGLLTSLGATTPKKHPNDRYESLWSKSPFTVPAEPDPGDEPPGELDDYLLSGVSKLPAGYFVVLMNKKKRDERISIIPGETNPRGFKVVSVMQDPSDYKATQVMISVRGQETGMVRYDEKFLPLKRPGLAKKPAPPKPGVRPQRPPTSSGSTSSRTTRLRRLPTPPER
jgi:hypothetical protein